MQASEDLPTRGGRSGVSVEPGQQTVQVGGREPPLERLCRGVVAVFECSKPIPDLGEVGEVARCRTRTLGDPPGSAHLRSCLFHTRTKTDRAPQLNKATPDMWVEISEADAATQDLAEGDLVEVRSPRGALRGRLRRASPGRDNPAPGSGHLLASTMRRKMPTTRAAAADITDRVPLSAPGRPHLSPVGRSVAVRP
ncbi:molybdopterin dinucleotide binding domain-containing protein [Streptomyces sp. NPDC005131]